MNKRFKIVSSIALAGMLLTGSLGMNKVNAAEPVDSYQTNPVAVYRKLVEGKTVVPFVLANKNDKLTAREIVESDMFKGKVKTINGVAVSSLDEVVGTGDRFETTDGTEYTVVVYGDIDGSGTITPDDALEVEKYLVDMVDFNDVQKEAADVGVNDGNITPDDSLRIKTYWVDIDNTIIDNLPPKEEVVEDSNYSMTLNDGGYINNVNATESKLGVTLSETLDKEATLKLVVSDSDEATDDDIERNVVIPAHTDYVEITGIDLSSLAEGNVTANLYDGDKIVATVNIVKNTVAPAATNVRTNRISTRKATLSLEKLGSSDVTKVRYVVKGIDETATEEELTNSADVQNNKLTDATIAENLATDTAYKVFYVVENQYGSVSDVKEAIIASDSASVHAATKLDAVETPDLTAVVQDEDTNFTFVKNEEDKESHTYIATLYKDGVAVSEKETTDEFVSFKDEMTKPGTYKVSVVVKGDSKGEETTNSEATVSEEVTVSALKSVEGLTMQKDDEGNVVLSWSNPNGKDDFKAYEINLYRLDKEGKEVFDKTITPCKNEENTVNVDVEDNTIYVAKVKVVAKDNQMATTTSAEVSSNQFYVVEAPDVTSAKKGSASIKFDVEPIEIFNKDVTYKVEVYDVDLSGDPTKPAYTLNSTRNVTIDENNQVTIDGLNPTTYYAFRLVATVEGNEVKSEYSSPIETLPVFDSVEVTTDVEAAKKENSNKVAIDGTKIVMENGAEYDTAVIDELEAAKNVIASLKDGDVVTMNDDATVVSIDLDGGASAEDHIRNFGTTFAKSTVEITSNEFSKTITGTFKALTLKGTNSIFTLDGATVTEDIVLTDDVEVTANVVKEYKVEAGATATINDVKVTTDEEVTLTANSGKNLVVDANTTANDLVFENSTNGDATIEFKGSDDNTSEQRGTVTIKTNGGKVTVTSDKVNVSADMKVEVNNGTVEIKDPSLTGDKTVTVSADEDKSSTIIAKTQTKAPKAIDDKELKEYTDDEIKEIFEVEKQEDVNAIREYINSFGLNGTGARITVDESDLGVATIVLPGEAQDVNIGNLK